MAQILDKSVVSIRRYEQGKPNQKIGIVTSWLKINQAGGDAIGVNTPSRKELP